MSLLVDQESPRAHVAKFYSRLRLTCSVWRASKFSVFKIDLNCNSVGLLHHPFWLRLVFRRFWGINFQPFVNYFVWPRITDEGSVPEMRIWSILLIRSDLKWCIHLSRSLFLYSNCPKYRGVSREEPTHYTIKLMFNNTNRGISIFV